MRSLVTSILTLVLSLQLVASEVVLTFPAASGVHGPVNVSGAVGPHHVISASQAGVVIQNRSGAVLASYTLQEIRVLSR